MDLKITGRVAIVTGASTGIGLHTARILQTEGARLLLTDLPGSDWSKAESLLSDFEKIDADLTGQDACQSVVDRATERLGGCHILVHTAGIAGEKRASAGDVRPSVARRLGSWFFFRCANVSCRDPTNAESRLGACGLHHQ